MILATKDTALTMVANTKTDALPKGDLHLAWKKLERRWDPKSREDKIDSLTNFIRPKMDNIRVKPQDWMAHMEKTRNELEHAGCEMDDETFLTYVMASLPQEQYQATILTLKAKLREDAQTIEEAETLLDDKFEAMKEVQGWTEDGDVVGKPHFKKMFKGQCGYCNKYGHKAADCHERKANLENKETGQGKFKPN